MASLIVSLDLASDRPSEVMVSALIRARFCELLAPEAGLEPPNGEYFMLGLFSRLDAMFSRPLADILKDILLPDQVRATLLDPGSAYEYPLPHLEHDSRLRSGGLGARFRTPTSSGSQLGTCQFHVCGCCYLGRCQLPPLTTTSRVWFPLSRANMLVC